MRKMLRATAPRTRIKYVAARISSARCKSDLPIAQTINRVPPLSCAACIDFQQLHDLFKKCMALTRLHKCQSVCIQRNFEAADCCAIRGFLLNRHRWPSRSRLRKIPCNHLELVGILTCSDLPRAPLRDGARHNDVIICAYASINDSGLLV